MVVARTTPRNLQQKTLMVCRTVVSRLTRRSTLLRSSGTTPSSGSAKWRPTEPGCRGWRTLAPRRATTPSSPARGTLTRGTRLGPQQHHARPRTMCRWLRSRITTRPSHLGRRLATARLRVSAIVPCCHAAWCHAALVVPIALLQACRARFSPAFGFSKATRGHGVGAL
jgi:hypothetical protein